MSDTKTDSEQPGPQTVEHDRDEALDETFPASDPPATGGITGPDDKGPG